MGRALNWTLAGLLVAGCAGAGYLVHDAGSPQAAWARVTSLAQGASATPSPAAAATPAPAAARPPAVVEAIAVTIGRVTEQVQAVGTVQSNESVTIRPEISGRIARLMLEEGTQVAAGQPLIQLDDRILRAEFSQADASLKLAEKNFERANTLAAQGTATARSRDEAIATLQLARASAELAKARLDKSVIMAPFAGIVGFKTRSTGDYVTPSDALVNIESVDPVKLDFRVPETNLAAVKVGQKVTVIVDALPNRPFAGEIYAINPQIDVNGRALQIRARIPNPDLILRPGLFARVTLQTAARDNAIMVPEAAIVAQGGERYVYRVENNRAFRTKVEIGQRQRGVAEIRTGLKPDAVVVTAGQAKLREGAAVETVRPGSGA